MRRETVTGSTRLAINALAWLCRKLWNETSGSLRAFTNRRQSRLRLLGGIGSPSMVEKTSVPASNFPKPNCNLSSSWRLRCACSAPTAIGGNATTRRLEFQACARLFEAALNADAGGGQVDVS